jgi:hypothetical protein
MIPGVLARETVDDHGELRAYHLADRADILLEVFREEDGRAWQLRLPVRERAAVAQLIRQVQPSLAAPAPLAFDADGAALLGQAPMGPDDEITAVALAEGEDRAFALWRRERLRAGWSWTVDVALVPLDLAPQLCGFVLQALNALDTPDRNHAPR